jgi:hypothetical protein
VVSNRTQARCVRSVQPGQVSAPLDGRIGRPTEPFTASGAKPNLASDRSSKWRQPDRNASIIMDGNSHHIPHHTLHHPQHAPHHTPTTPRPHNVGAEKPGFGLGLTQQPHSSPQVHPTDPTAGVPQRPSLSIPLPQNHNRGAGSCAPHSRGHRVDGGHLSQGRDVESGRGRPSSCGHHDRAAAAYDWDSAHQLGVGLGDTRAATQDSLQKERARQGDA